MALMYGVSCSETGRLTHLSKHELLFLTKSRVKLKGNSTQICECNFKKLDVSSQLDTRASPRLQTWKINSLCTCFRKDLDLPEIHFLGKNGSSILINKTLSSDKF